LRQTAPLFREAYVVTSRDHEDQLTTLVRVAVASAIAAILILGLLFLATSKAGLKVLGVLVVLVVTGVGALLYQDHLTTLAQQQECAA
jgi:hypothetical protein